MAHRSPVVVWSADPCLQAPDYVNSDCGAKAVAFDRIQVDALVRMATAEAGMVDVMSRFEVRRPHDSCGALIRCQYSSANMMMSTRVTMGASSRPLTPGSSYKPCLKMNFWSSISKLPKSCSLCGSLSPVKATNVATLRTTIARTSEGRESTPLVKTNFPSVGSKLVRSASLSSRMRSRVAELVVGMCSSTQSARRDGGPTREDERR